MFGPGIAVTNATFTGSSAMCPECGTPARIIDGTYSFFADAIRITLAATVGPEDRAAIEGFLSAMRARQTAPTPEELDQEFGDVPVEVRDAFRALVKTAGWKKTVKFIAWLLPTLLGLYDLHLGLHFDGRSEVRWARNLRRNPQVSVHIGSGDEPVIVEGTVAQTEEQGDEAGRVTGAYEVKYGFPHPAPFWRLTPQRAFAWTDLGNDTTRWVLPS